MPADELLKKCEITGRTENNKRAITERPSTVTTCTMYQLTLMNYEMMTQSMGLTGKPMTSPKLRKISS